MKKKCYQSKFVKLALASIGTLLLGGVATFSASSAPVYADTSFNDRGFICKIKDDHPDEATLVAINNGRAPRFAPPDPHNYADRCVIPEFVFFNERRYSVTRIENRTSLNSLFSNPEFVTEVVIPASVKVIGANMFRNLRNLKGVNFPFNSQLQTIGAYAFAGCRSLKSIYPPDSVKELGDSAFESTGVVSVRLPENLATVGKRVFSHSHNLTDLDLPKGVKIIGERMFEDSRELKAVNFPDTLQSIGNSAFVDSGILEANISDSVTTLGERIFQGSNLRAIKFPQGLKIIPKGICCDTKLSEVTFPENTRKIGSDAFAFTKSLETVILPPKLENIGQGAYCSSDLSSIVIPAGLKKIGKFAFSSCNNLQKINLPSSLEEVNKLAFANCLDLRSVVVEPGSNQLTTFESEVFNRCRSLISFTAHKPVSFADPINLADDNPVFENQHCPMNRTGFYVPREWLSSLSNE